MTPDEWNALTELEKMKKIRDFASTLDCGLEIDVACPDS
jgi:hypothetical protein